MQVRSRSAPRTPAKPDRLTFVYLVAFLYGEVRQMQIERQQALAVVNDDAISFKEQRPRQNNSPAIRRGDRSSTRHAEIQPLMRALHGAVEDALDSENIRDLGIHRSSERTLPFAFGTERLKNLRLDFFVLFDLALVFRAGRGIASRNFQRARADSAGVEP